MNSDWKTELLNHVTAAGVEPFRLNRMEGNVISCDGERAVIAARYSPDCGASTDYWAVGKLITIRVGECRIVGLIYSLDMEESWVEDGSNLVRVHVELQGEIRPDVDGCDRFFSGIDNYPHVGAIAHRIRTDDLAAIYATEGSGAIRIGALVQDETVPAFVAVDKLLSRHFAVVGTTGVGKSTALSLLLRKIVIARRDIRVLLLDPHDEFTSAFPNSSVTVDASTLELPFWLFQFEELVSVLYRGQPPVPEELDLLRDLIPAAREEYGDEAGAYRLRRLRRPDARAITVDTPVPYRMGDVLRLIREREGLLDGKPERPFLRALRLRLESIIADPRFRFMFLQRGPGDRLAHILARIFRAPMEGRPICVIEMSGLPCEVVSAVVSVLARLTFELAVASDGAIATLLICEEAHRYVPADLECGFRPTRTAIARIAKEGRKYGAYLGVVSQRPGELDPTVLSQCSTIFSMRLGNARDKDIIAQAVSGAARSTLSFLPSLADREAIAFGEAVPAPMRMRFETVEACALPCAHDHAAASGTGPDDDLMHRTISRLRQQDARPAVLTTFSRGDPRGFS